MTLTLLTLLTLLTSRKLQGVCGKDKLGNIIESCTLARSEEHLKHSCRWVLLEQLLVVPKHVTLSQKMPLALLVSIPLTLLTSREVLPCAHRADMSLDIFQRSELARVRSPPLFEQDRDRAKLQGVWGWGKTPIGKRVASCTFASKKRRALET